MTRFTDEQMQAAMTQTREYTVVLLEAGPQYGTEEAKPIIWEHGRRNFELRADGLLNIVCPITDDSPLCGVGIFSGSAGRRTPNHGRRSRCPGRCLHLPHPPDS
jgi:hypothetical protein